MIAAGLTRTTYAALGLLEDEALGELLGALVGGALLVVREPRLAHRPARAGVEDVEGRCMDDPCRPGLTGGSNDVASSLRVHSVESVEIGGPLFEHPHAIDRRVDSARGAAQRFGIGDVSSGDLRRLR